MPPSADAACIYVYIFFCTATARCSLCFNYTWILDKSRSVLLFVGSVLKFVVHMYVKLPTGLQHLVQKIPNMFRFNIQHHNISWYHVSSFFPSFCYVRTRAHATTFISDYAPAWVRTYKEIFVITYSHLLQLFTATGFDIARPILVKEPHDWRLPTEETLVSSSICEIRDEGFCNNPCTPSH